MGEKITMGAWGERRAAEYLRSEGIKLVETNFRSKIGEIDIIALENNKTVLFIEVKTRAGLSQGLPCEAVNKHKMRRLSMVAAYYMSLNSVRASLGNMPEHRFDVIEILLLNGKAWLRHIRDAFRIGDAGA
ncbi:MAG: YraN family protein [Clostridiales Family XIII bacterium]|jgi:putative endonuclease|nr:YraN family protein [Clostridiales Family XIII bacterium]